MKKSSSPSKTFALVTAFLLFAVIQINYAATALLESKRASLIEKVKGSSANYPQITKGRIDNLFLPWDAVTAVVKASPFIHVPFKTR